MQSLFSQRLKALRIEYDETQTDVAEVLSVRNTTYGEYERGRILPPYDKIKRLAEHFDVSVEYLMGESSFKKPQSASEQAGIDMLNINNVVRLLLDDLNDSSAPVNVDGAPLDSLARDMLKNALQNCLNIGEMVSKQSKN